MDKQKKTFIIGGIVEGLVLIFDLVISILVWTKIPSEDVVAKSGKEFAVLCKELNGEFIGFFQGNPTAFFCIICIPLFAIIALDFVYFAILASKKESKLTEGQLESIRAQAKAQAEAELLAEMQAEEKARLLKEKEAKEKLEGGDENPKE